MRNIQQWWNYYFLCPFCIAFTTLLPNIIFIRVYKDKRRQRSNRYIFHSWFLVLKLIFSERWLIFLMKMHRSIRLEIHYSQTSRRGLFICSSAVLTETINRLFLEMLFQEAYILNAFTNCCKDEDVSYR